MKQIDYWLANDISVIENGVLFQTSVKFILKVTV